MTPNGKLLVALFLGAVAFVPLFALGEGVRIPPAVPGAAALQGVIFVGGMAAYFFFCAFFLSRGDPRSLARLWPIPAALGVPLFIAVVIALGVEPNKGAVLWVAGAWLLGFLSAAAGTTLGWHANRA